MNAKKKITFWLKFESDIQFRVELYFFREFSFGKVTRLILDRRDSLRLRGHRKWMGFIRYPKLCVKDLCPRFLSISPLWTIKEIVTTEIVEESRW